MGVALGPDVDEKKRKSTKIISGREIYMCPTFQNSSSQEIPPGEARILVVVVVLVVVAVGGRCKKMETVRWRPRRAPF